VGNRGKTVTSIMGSQCRCRNFVIASRVMSALLPTGWWTHYITEASLLQQMGEIMTLTLKITGNRNCQKGGQWWAYLS